MRLLESLQRMVQTAAKGLTELEELDKDGLLGPGEVDDKAYVVMRELFTDIIKLEGEQRGLSSKSTITEVAFACGIATKKLK